MYDSAVLPDYNPYVVSIQYFQNFVRSCVLFSKFAGFDSFNKYLISRFKSLRIINFSVIILYSLPLSVLGKSPMISMATLSKEDPGVSVIITSCLVFTRTSFFNLYCKHCCIYR